jgi:hypothetical protein
MVFEKPLYKRVLGLQQCPTKPSLCQVFKTLINSLKYFKLTNQAIDNLKTTLMFRKFEHMCYFNVQAPITTKNAY